MKSLNLIAAGSFVAAMTVAVAAGAATLDDVKALGRRVEYFDMPAVRVEEHQLLHSGPRHSDANFFPHADHCFGRERKRARKARVLGAQAAAAAAADAAALEAAGSEAAADEAADMADDLEDAAEDAADTAEDVAEDATPIGEDVVEDDTDN